MDELMIAPQIMHTFTTGSSNVYLIIRETCVILVMKLL